MQCRDCANALVTFKQDFVERGNEYRMGFCRPLLVSVQVRLERACDEYRPLPDNTQLPLELREPTSLELFSLARANNKTVGDHWNTVNG